MSTTNKPRATEAMTRLIRDGGVFDYSSDRSRFLLAVMRTLGQGRPVSIEQVDQLIVEVGISRDDAHGFLSKVAERGPDDAIMGILGLSLNETPHRFTVNGKPLFTWCAADTLFLPALLGQAASIESTSPTSGTKVRLTVGLQAVQAFDPTGTVVSFVVVDPDAADTSSVEAIWGTFCHHIFFFATRQEADGWAAGRDNRNDIEILSVDEAFELAQLLSSALLARAA